MTDDEYLADRQKQIATFKAQVAEAIAEAERLNSSAPIWALFNAIPYEHVVDFADCGELVKAAHRIENRGNK